MDTDYWSIDSIFAENQKINCTFRVEVPNLGHIDGAEERNIAPDTKIQLPYWIASALLLRDYVVYNIPQPFSPRIKNALNADSRSVKLSLLVGGGGSWYGFGKKIFELLVEPQSTELATVLQKAFQERLGDLIDQAQHFVGSASSVGGSVGGGNEFREGLESSERQLFLLAQTSSQRTKAWYESTDKR